MTDTRLDTARPAEQRPLKASAPSHALGKGVGAADDAVLVGFSAVLASLGSQVAAEPMGDAVADEEPLLLAPTLLQTDAQDSAALTNAMQQGHTPWMSLVGQTARLDGKVDADLRRGVAGDFLSGRGNAVLQAQRQSTGAVAHAAFMVPAAGLQSGADAQPNTQTSGNLSSEAGLPAMLSAADAADTRELTPSHRSDVLNMAQPLLADKAMHGAIAANAGGINLQDMTAVQPQEWAGLRDWLKSGQAQSAATGFGQGADGAAAGVQSVQAGAHSGAHAGAQTGQGAGQDASNWAQTADNPVFAGSEREQEISEQVAFWVHQKNHNAALSIEHEGRPIQVQVQLQGQQAHVRFAADDLAARQWLSEGEAQLRELLQSQGLQLAGVSVDSGAAQNQSGRESDRNSQANGAAGARLGRVQISAAAAVSDTEPMGSPSNGRRVDLFV